MLLIFSFSFAQRNLRAGLLTVKKEATFKSGVTFYNYISSKSIARTVDVTASGAWGASVILITGQAESFVETIIVPQTIILSGGTCDGASVTITQVGWTAGNVMCSLDGDAPCTDYTGTSLIVASNKKFTSENHFNIYGNIDLNVRYKYHSHLDCEGPMSAYGTMFEIISGKDVVDQISHATHLWYSNPNCKGNYFKIDSVVWNGTNTLIYSNSLVSGLSSSIDDVYLYTLLGDGGNLTMKGKLIVGDHAETDFKFSLHGDAKITGRLRVNHIGDTGTYNYTPQAVWISSDSILIGKESGDYSNRLRPGDSIAKSDDSWIREIKSSEYGDFSHLGLAFSYATLIIYNGADVGDAGTTNVKAWHYPDLEITLSEGDNLYVKTFKGSNNVTGWIMINSVGNPCYVYPNATGNGITVSTTKP